MALKSYNNNDRTPTISVYSGIVFTNPESNISQTKFSISYFNKVMKVSIAMKNNGGSNNDFSTYDNDNAVVVYISNTKAEILYNLIQRLKTDKDTHNVCIELKNGLMKVSDGAEFGSPSPCISISYASEDGSVHEIVYQTKHGFHNGAVNYSNGEFSTVTFDDIELDTFAMCLHEYYKASSYAIAATVWEANMYRRDYDQNLIRSIAEKVGVSIGSNNNTKFNNKTFLSSSDNSTSGNSTDIIPKEYETSTFDAIAGSLM